MAPPDASQPGATAGIDDVRRLVGLEHGLATACTVRADGTVQATVVNAGVVDHPRTGAPVAAFLARPGTRKLAHLSERPTATLSWRAGWAWVTVEGRAELIGPDHPAPDLDARALAMLLRAIYTASGGGEHDDWAEFDRVVVAERRTAVLVAPTRIYLNP
jgi:PPOX class probable F420-dependent enzyme